MTAQAPSSDAGGGRAAYRATPLDDLAATRSAREYATGRRGRMSDYVYDELSSAIRSLRLAPGAALSEPAVAAWLDVSRAPVRDAFTRLVEQRFVIVVPQVGSQVAPISMADVHESVFVRDALETAAFRQAIAAEDLDTRELQHVVTRNREAAERGDMEEFFETDEQLHHLVFALGGVPHVWQFVSGTKMHLDRLRRLSLPSSLRNAEVIGEHQAIVDALNARDGEHGEQVTHQHAYRIFGEAPRIRAEHPDYFV